MAWIADGLVGTKDAEVLALAVRESRLLVTQDTDFGELAFRSKLPATRGVVLFRMTPEPALVAAIAGGIAGSRSERARELGAKEPEAPSVEWRPSEQQPQPAR